MVWCKDFLKACDSVLLKIEMQHLVLFEAGSGLGCRDVRGDCNGLFHTPSPLPEEAGLVVHWRSELKPDWC